MGKHEKFLLKILSGSSDRNNNFDDLRSFLKQIGFKEYNRSSHHMFRKEGVEEKINFQKEGNNAKPYQVKQVRNVIQKYGLGGLSDA
ncbi:MAG: type II toxin-antitoxin system HicA family toxin [Candidatus Omnitrophota bacterium]